MTPPRPGQTRLIVNADDFGLSPGVNAGVIAAYEQGILTSATILANGPFFHEAARLALAHPGLGVGLHLNLVRGKPLSPPEEIPLLADDGGLRRFRLRRMSQSFLRQAEQEYRRQFERVIAAGIAPTHIDFEKHHAWQAPLYRLACRLARDYGVRAVRTLREPVAWSIRHIGWPGLGAAFRAALLRCGVQRAESEGLARPEYLLGQTHIGAMTEAAWLRLLANPLPGVAEVMTHPGMKDAESGTMGASWLDGKREAELAALVSPRVRAAAEAAGVAFINFGDGAR